MVLGVCIRGPLATVAALAVILLRGRVEPDADADGYGDETQDKCPGKAGANSGCPPAKKKCKNKGKKKAAAAKKKKGCKKRRKKRK